MSENRVPEEEGLTPGGEEITPVEEDIETPTDETVEDNAVPAALREVDPERLQEIRDKIKAFAASRGQTISGSEAPSDVPTQTEDGKPLGETVKGSDVDWSEYDLEYSVRHLYPQASYRMTAQGPKWVVFLDEFFSTERAGKQHGKMVNAPGTSDGELKESLNLGEYLSQMVNSSEGWKIAALLPGSSGQALVLLQKKTPMALPEPTKIKKAIEVEAPTDPELQAAEDSAIAFMQEEGLTPPPIEEDNGGEEVLRPVPADQVEVDEVGALPSRDSTLVSRAIDLNRAETTPPPVGAQPPPVEVAEPGILGEGGRVASGIVDLKNVIGDIMGGEDFGTVEPPAR